MIRTVAVLLLLLVSAPAWPRVVVPSIFVPPLAQISVEESFRAPFPPVAYAIQPQQLMTNLLRFNTPKDRAFVSSELDHTSRSSQQSRSVATQPQPSSHTPSGGASLPEGAIDEPCPACQVGFIDADYSMESSSLVPPLPGAGSPFRFTPVIRLTPTEPNPATKVQWRRLFESSLRYLTVMHSFRLATEAGTRDGLHSNVWGGYFKSLGAMHGWSDGDGYFENYLGHPIEGTVSAYIWIKNDPRYRAVEFGKDPNYWKSRLRAYAFSWAFSAQFEIGPISEASIGQIQRYCCQYGFVDHVITPNGGMVWTVAEDIVDKYVVRAIEDRTRNVGVRIATRLALNPLESFANFMTWQYPWNRENRDAPSTYTGKLRTPPVSEEEQIGRFELPLVPKFEIAATVPSLMRMGNLSCLGGGGVAGIRLSDVWQWTLEVSGCTLGNSLPQNWSGDSLTFTTGPQWIRHTASRWTPHAHLRFGGQKITEQHADPERRKQIENALPPGRDLNPYYDLFTKNYESTALSLSVGGGIDFRLHAGMALRVASLDYVRSWLNEINQTNFNRGLRFTTGVVLRLGTW
jgi:hypothetical protein